MSVRAGSSVPEIIPGAFTMAATPSASINYHRMCWVTDRPGGAGLMLSDGSNWLTVDKRSDCYAGTTNGSGQFSKVYDTPFQSIPHVNPVCDVGADSTTRVRLIASSTAGFTVQTEKNSGLQVLGIDVLGLATAAVPTVPVRVFVTESST